MLRWIWNKLKNFMMVDIELPPGRKITRRHTVPLLSHKVISCIQINGTHNY